MKYFILIFAILFSACSVKNYEHTKSKLFIIKSPLIKFADLGYVRNSSQDIEIELFMAGKSIKKIEINHLICVDDGCMTKSGFNEDYLHESYPADILQNILLGNPIYDKLNLEKNELGFTQKIKNKKVYIKYKVDNNQIFFKDIKNRIIFKIKEIN